MGELLGLKLGFQALKIKKTPLSLNKDKGATPG